MGRARHIDKIEEHTNGIPGTSLFPTFVHGASLSRVHEGVMSL